MQTLKMIYRYPSESKMYFNRDMDCHFDYLIVDGEEKVDGYFDTMQEAKEDKPKVTRKPRK